MEFKDERTIWERINDWLGDFDFMGGLLIIWIFCIVITIFCFLVNM